MRRILLLAAAALLVNSACTPNADGTASEGGADANPSAVDDSPIVAEVAGVAITTAELDAWIKEDLFASEASNPNSLYALREAGIQRMISERGLQTLADQGGVSVDQLVADKITALGPVTDDHEPQPGRDA